MKLIIGGAYQGKRAYTRSHYGISENEMYDGAEIRIDRSCRTVKCILNYHLLIRRLMNEGSAPEEFTLQLLESSPDVIIIMDEIGSGIIPMERAEREWREAVGQIGCFLAERAESVERIVCGLAVKLK